MSTVHFLDVDPGDCSIIQHQSGWTTMIDVCSAYPTPRVGLSLFNPRILTHPVNPVQYLRGLGVSRLDRLIVTHPDMDHIDGIASIAAEFQPFSFWDTNNNKMIASNQFRDPRQAQDWNAYQTLRDNPAFYNCLRSVVESGCTGDDGGILSGLSNEYLKDEIVVLSPSRDLLASANQTGDFNDASCVVLYKTRGNRILFCGDSHDKTWEHILNTFPYEVENIDIMLAPHHGRKSGRNWEFLDHTQPKLTIFGRAPSGYLSYHAWNRRDLPFLTRPKVGSVIAKVDIAEIKIYVTSSIYNRYDGKSFTDCVFNRGFYWGKVTWRAFSDHLTV